MSLRSLASTGAPARGELGGTMCCLATLQVAPVVRNHPHAQYARGWFWPKEKGQAWNKASTRARQPREKKALMARARVKKRVQAWNTALIKMAKAKVQICHKAMLANKARAKVKTCHKAMAKARAKVKTCMANKARAKVNTCHKAMANKARARASGQKAVGNGEARTGLKKSLGQSKTVFGAEEKMHRVLLVVLSI